MHLTSLLGFARSLLSSLATPGPSQEPLWFSVGSVVVVWWSAVGALDVDCEISSLGRVVVRQCARWGCLFGWRFDGEADIAPFGAAFGEAEHRVRVG